MRGRAGRLGSFAGMGCALVLAAGVARADYCAHTGTSAFDVGGVTVELSARATLVSCTVEGTTCADGTVCQRLGPMDSELFCAPLATDPVVWACSGGCACPMRGAVVATHVAVSTSDGMFCLCDYGGAAELCPGIGDSPQERFVRCHTALATRDTGTLVDFANGDCDGDGYPNSCEGMGGDRCEPCAHPAPGDCTSAVPEIVVPACAADAGATGTDASRPDGGATNLDASVPGADAGGATGTDAGGEGAFDAGSTPDDPPAGATFRGAGGCVCGIASAARTGRAGAWASVLGLGLGLALAVIRPARRRRP